MAAHGRLQRRQSPVMESGKLADMVMDLEWYAIRTPPQKEFVAQEILTQRGVVTFCPADKRWRRQNRYTKEKQLISYPMVVRYVFAGFIPGVPAWFNLFQLPCIQGCVGINGKPMKLDHAAMEGLLRRYPNGIQRPKEEKYMRTHAEYKAGDLVRICDGPFDGMIVPVHELKGRDAYVFMDLFGAQHKIKIDAGLLEAA